MTKSGKSDLHQEIARLEATLREDPNSLEFHRLADAYTRFGRFLDAIRVCQEGIRHHPQLPEGYVAQGRALFGTGKLNKAIKVLRKAIFIPGGGVEPYRLLGEILLRKDAPTEAVTLLEDAVERGVDERSILNLLERARRAVETEQTSVIEMASIEQQRGIGNIAVAGTIGATSEVDVAKLHKQLYEELEAEPDVDSHKTPRVDTDRTEVHHQVDAPDWSSIDDEWEQELDARNTGAFADLESDVGGPFDRPRMLELPPLTDPLTEGMPPLPPDDDSGAVVLPEARARLVTPTQAAAVDQGGVSEEARTLVKVGVEDPTPLVKPIEFAETMLAIVAEPMAPGEEPPELPDDEIPHRPWQPEPPLEPPPEKAGQVEFEDLIGLSGPEAEAEPAAEVDVDDLGLPPVELAESLPPQFPTPGTPRRRGIWMLVVFLLCSAAGGAGVFLWRRHHGAATVKSTLDLGRQARLLGASDVIELAARAAEAAIASGVSDSAVAGELELMRAMLWLHFGIGKQPVVTASHTPWSHCAARAMVRLASGDVSAARGLLEPEPEAKLDRAMRLHYLAWADWAQGRQELAGQKLGQALEHAPGLANALLLRGQMARELGDLEGAEQACREAQQRSPSHQLAAACLASILVERGVSGAEDEEELRRLMALSPQGPVGKAWHQLITAEQALRNGDPAGGQKAQAALAPAPPRPALLFKGVEVLILAGQLDVALVAWDRLARVRSPIAPSLQLLHARLQLSQGLGAVVLEQVKGKGLSPAARVVRAWALLDAGQPAEVGGLLAGLGSQEVSVARAAAAALQDRSAPLGPLRELARSSRHARLYLGQALLIRGDAKGAASEAEGLVAVPPVHLQAMALLARAQMASNELGKAIGTLSEAVHASSAAYLPASELLGLTFIDLGRFSEAERTLSHVVKAGRVSLGLAMGLVRASAMAGHPDEAEAALAEFRKLGATPDQEKLLVGHISLARGRPVEAAQDLEQAKSVVDLIALGRACMEAGKSKAAEKAFTRAAEVDSVHPLPHLWLGKLMLAGGQAAGERQLATAIQRTRTRRHFPSSIIAEATIGIARLKLAKGRPDAAVVKLLEEAIAVAPSNATLHRLQGEVYIKLRRHALARKALTKCTALNPADATAYYLLGIAAQAKQQQARQALLQFLKLEPKGKRAALVRRKLGRMH